MNAVKLPKGWERIPVGEWSKIGDRYLGSVTGKWETEYFPTLVKEYHVPFIRRAVKLPAKKPKAKTAKKASRLPKGLPPLPPGLKYRGLGNGGKWRPFSGAILRDGEWCRESGLTGLFKGMHYAMEIKPKPRRESLTARIATAIQTGQNKPAMDTAREVMRILDNHNRAKRRKEGK